VDEVARRLRAAVVPSAAAPIGPTAHDGHAVETVIDPKLAEPTPLVPG
jgi:hypothetical protein